jgi:hypothetical protein
MAFGPIHEIHFLGLQWSISEARFVSGVFSIRWRNDASGFMCILKVVHSRLPGFAFFG